MRIRTIKPEFWRSDDITALSREDRLLFIGLWSYVDDNGVGIDDYRQIAADLFALEDDQNGIRDYVRESLATLSRGLLITRYEVSGKRYLHITNWAKHQRIDRPGKPRYPLPAEGPTSGNVFEPNEFATHSRESRDTPSTGTGEQGNRGTEEKKTSSSSSATAQPPRPDVEELCTRLHQRVTENGAKPTITNKWRTEARLLLDRDGRDHDQALRLIDWVTSNDFWKPNILAMPKFREKYDQLLMQARREQQQRRPQAGNFASQTDANIAAFLGATGTEGATILELPRGAQ